MAATRADAPPVIRIRRSRGWAALNLREVWEYRELLYFLTWRDVKITARRLPRCPLIRGVC